MAVYQADTLSERPIYGSSRLGNLSYASKPGYRTVGHKQYELSNHLGNVLAVVSDRIRMKTDSTWTQVLSRTDYYPFGLEMTGRTESMTYRYGFNGKEKDPSGQWSNQTHYDYGFRIYNPTIGKFLSVDPLTKSYPELTPYQFASNTPIQAIDLDGLEAVTYPGVGTTTEMLTKPTDQEVKQVYDAYRGITLGLWDVVSTFKPEARIVDSRNSIDPNYIPLYSEAKEAYKGISQTLEEGTTEDRFRLGTVAVIGAFGGLKSFSRFKNPFVKSSKPLNQSNLPANYWPHNEGALGEWSGTMAEVGQRLDRYGSIYGLYASPIGTPIKMRSLSPTTNLNDYFQFEVIKPFPLRKSRIAPAFGEPGLGIQYQTPIGINYLEEFRYIKIIK